MSESRGMQYAAYTTDRNVVVAMRVSINDFGQSARGWAAATDGAMLGSKGFKPRKVHGISPTSGRRSSAIVASVTADLWTGAASTWTENTDANTTDTYTVTGYRGEQVTLVRA